MGFKPMACDTGAMFYDLSYEATQLGAGQFVGLTYSSERIQRNKEINNYFINVTFHGKTYTNAKPLNLPKR